MTMLRDDAIRTMIAHRDHAVIVATYQAAFDLMRIDPNPLNYVSIGAMGIASSHALGLALGLPERRVMVFNGDVSLLMNLASLVTIAAAAPRNLIHFLFENGCYEANGSHPLPNAAAIDFQAIAKGAGLPYWTQVAGAAHLVVPYSLTNNDARFIRQALATADDFYSYLCDSFDLLYREGATQPKMMSVGLHMRLAGHPERAMALERFLDHVTAHERVWVTRRVDIANHWRKEHPPR